MLRGMEANEPTLNPAESIARWSGGKEQSSVRSKPGSRRRSSPLSRAGSEPGAWAKQVDATSQEVVPIS